MEEYQKEAIKFFIITFSLLLAFVFILAFIEGSTVPTIKDCKQLIEGK